MRCESRAFPAKSHAGFAGIRSSCGHLLALDLATDYQQPPFRKPMQRASLPVYLIWKRCAGRPSQWGGGAHARGVHEAHHF
jgi:hypothetical protein